MTTEQHDEEFKRKTVESLFDSGKSLKSFARDLGVAPADLKEWRREYRRQYVKGLPRSKFAVAGSVFGLLAVVSFFCLSNMPGEWVFFPLMLLCAACGLLSASIGLVQTNLNRARKRGHTLAVAGLFLSLLPLVPFVFIPLRIPHERARRPACQNNLKQMGLVFKMYADEHAGEVFPPLSSEPGRLMFDNEAGGGLPVYPEFLTDYNVLFCPHDEDDPLDAADADEDGAISMEELEDVLDDYSYFYLGYVVTNDTDVEAFAEAYRECIANGTPFANNLTVQAGRGNAGTDTVLRLREGVAKLLIDGDPKHEAVIAKQESEIPLLIERPDNHEPGGGNILYLDGHVEFHKYPGRWPMTENTMGILESLDAMGKTEAGT